MVALETWTSRSVYFYPDAEYVGDDLRGLRPASDALSERFMPSSLRRYQAAPHMVSVDFEFEQPVITVADFPWWWPLWLARRQVAQVMTRAGVSGYAVAVVRREVRPPD